MKLQQLLLAYEFDEIMPIINDMFPGTAKYRKPLKTAYDIMTTLKPVASRKTIHGSQRRRLQRAMGSKFRQRGDARKRRRLE